MGESGNEYSPEQLYELAEEAEEVKAGLAEFGVEVKRDSAGKMVDIVDTSGKEGDITGEPTEEEIKQQADLLEAREKIRNIPEESGVQKYRTEVEVIPPPDPRRVLKEVVASYSGGRGDTLGRQAEVGSGKPIAREVREINAAAGVKSPEERKYPYYEEVGPFPFKVKIESEGRKSIEIPGEPYKNAGAMRFWDIKYEHGVV